MSTLAPPTPELMRQELPPQAGVRGLRVYAIAFDMDIESLRQHYNAAYLKIRRTLERFGFRWQQGSTYFGGEGVNAVTCVLAAQALGALSWFAASVWDIRMLRIEEFNDLLPAVRAAGE